MGVVRRNLAILSLGLAGLVWATVLLDSVAITLAAAVLALVIAVAVGLRTRPRS